MTNFDEGKLPKWARNIISGERSLVKSLRKDIAARDARIKALSQAAPPDIFRGANFMVRLADILYFDNIAVVSGSMEKAWCVMRNGESFYITNPQQIIDAWTAYWRMNK